MALLRAFLERNSRLLNISVSLILVSICLACNVLLVLLYLTPASYHIESLVYSQPGNIKPAVIVTLITAIFTAATSGLITRSVEHALWLKLTPRAVKKRLTVGESSRVAQWSVSPIARLSYVFDGQFWTLKIGGILILSLSILTPVLVSGISQHEETAITTSSQPAQSSRFRGYIDTSNALYNGGNFRDIPGEIAALVSMSNQSAPAAPICSSDRLCSATTNVASFRASCQSAVFENPEDIGTVESDVSSLAMAPKEEFCSSINPSVCATLVSASPYTYANFTGGTPGDCEFVTKPCAGGAWATIFGVWINAPSLVEPHTLNIVDCEISLGTVDIAQTGDNPPQLQRNTFRQAAGDVNTSASDIVALHRIYTEDNGKQSPFTFVGAASGTGANTLFETAVGTLLLGGSEVTASGDTVARRIEAAYEMGTLLAFGRAPTASDLLFRQEVLRSVYDYDARVLIILLVPLLATFLGLWGRLKVGGDDVVIGYDPVEIASRGPVIGLSGGRKGEDRDRIGGLQVWGWRENAGEQGEDHTLIGKGNVDGRVNEVDAGRTRDRFMTNA
jgi:hypothetical protein